LNVERCLFLKQLGMDDPGAYKSAVDLEQRDRAKDRLHENEDMISEITYFNFLKVYYFES